MKNTPWQDTDGDYLHLAQWYTKNLPLLQIEYPEVPWGDYELEDWHLSRVRLTLEVHKNGKPIGKMPRGGTWGDRADTRDEVIDRAFALYMQRQNRKFSKPSWAEKWETPEEYEQRRTERFRQLLESRTREPYTTDNKKLRDFLNNLK